MTSSFSFRRFQGCREIHLLGQNSKLQGSTGVTSEFFPEETQKELRELVVDMRTFVNNANDILGDPNNKENIKVTLLENAEQMELLLKEIKAFAARTREKGLPLKLR
jgi:hypothetical protein